MGVPALVLSSPPQEYPRRRSSSPVLLFTSRKSLRIYAFVILLITSLFFILAFNQVLYHPSTISTLLNAQNSLVGPISDHTDHPLDRFVSGFPSLRGIDERGFPELERRDEDIHKTPFDWARTRKMFVFGDSYSTLDLDYRKNGVDGGHHEKLHNRGTDMKWSDYLYSIFHDFHILQYYNFAKVGAVIDPNVIPPGSEQYGTFQTQIDDFEDLFTPAPGPSRVNWHGNDSLFISFFGINDMGRMNREDIGRKDVPTTAAELAKSMVNSCRRLHSLGARSFLLVNLPPLDQSPKYSLPHEVGILSHQLIKKSVEIYNQRLAEEVENWKEEVEDANIMLFDLESFWKLVLRYPEAFGMTECARYNMFIDGHRPNLGKMGYCYHDNQHISWSSAELIARTVNGFLHRHSRSFFENNATETTLHA